MGKRTKARECAFQMLYQWASSREPIGRVTEAFWSVRSTTDETRARAERLALGAHERIEAIDSVIQAASENWRLDRMAPVDLNIMRIATYELMAEVGTPVAVVLDEAVEMARRFGEEDSPAFVNGVLDRVMRELKGSGEGTRVRGS